MPRLDELRGRYAILTPEEQRKKYKRERKNARKALKQATLPPLEEQLKSFQLQRQVSWRTAAEGGGCDLDLVDPHGNGQVRLRGDAKCTLFTALRAGQEVLELSYSTTNAKGERTCHKLHHLRYVSERKAGANTTVWCSYRQGWWPSW